MRRGDAVPQWEVEEMPDDKPTPEPPDRQDRQSPSERDSIQGSGRVVEKGYHLVSDDPPTVSQAPSDGDGPPVNLPPDPPAGDD